MTKKVHSLKQLERHVMDRLGGNVRKNGRIERVVAEENSQSAYDIVYTAHSPTSYERRMDNDGLSDVRNIEVVDVLPLSGAIMMRIENMTEGNDNMQGQFITDTIEEGIESNWSKQGEWSKPRPFMSETHNRLEQDKSKLMNAFRETMRDLGFEVK